VNSTPFPVYIRESRETANLSLSGAAKLIGCSKGHLWDLERGNAFNPTIGLLANMAAAYQVDLGQIALICAASLPNSPRREVVANFVKASSSLRLIDGGRP